ncbi:MAG: chitobiase/beta-hexosaminidase C-terminal domain-containing protein [Bacteroidaceae bacterium]|nr:chitobiase/beta-hexosaminidase C-terminal domain-containing protein [Bacteroidaceae bacterium]
MKKFLLSLFTFFCVVATANAETYTHTFSKGELTTDAGTVALSDIEWNATEATAIEWNATKGIQIGNKNSPCTSYTLSTSGFTGCTIRSITVNSSIAASGDATVAITIGSQTSESYKLTTSDAAYTFDCDDTTGDITISWTASQRAYYVKSITVDYAPDASTVVIPAPEFKTPAVVYADKVEKVTVETADQSAVIYYTTDGTDPVYEDYINETGTTKSSKYYVMYFDLTTTTTIKAMAVRTDGDAVFKSDIAEQTYIVSRTMPYLTASEMTSGNKYAMIAADSAATYYYGAEGEGFLPTKTATDVNGKYTNTVECAGFTFTASNGGYTIQDELGRYIAPASNGFGFEASAVWNVTIDNNGNATITCDGKTIYYSTADATFGCYATATAEHVLPKLYMQREYPQYTITPESGSTMTKLETITVKCEERIKATSDLKIAVDGFKTVFTVSQPDNNTLVFTANEPIVSHNNYDISINITAGDIILNPEVMEMSLPVPVKYGVRTIAKYTITGDAEAAVIKEVTPANGTTVEELSYFVFTFSYYASHTDNTEIAPKLHLEGSDELITLEKSVQKADGTYIGMQQAALKTVEPVTANGTYILEIPTGYFCDGNGKDIEGITLKYTVENDTAIEDITADGQNGWVIYNTNGIKVLDTMDASKVKSLPSGIYIVNGIKTVIK